MSEQNDEENMKILFPTNLSNGECTVLVQIDPEDASTLDFTGATGAIGRLEADDTGVSFDFKGVQYKGTFYPTASAVVMGVVNGKENYLKIDGIADDFCYLEKTGDALKKFDAQAVGDMSGYNVQEEDVNRNEAKTHVEGATLNPEPNSKLQTLKGKRSLSKKLSQESASKKQNKRTKK